MNKRTSQLARPFILLLLVLVCFASPAPAAPVYNLSNDFSFTTNSDTSTWSYRYQTNGAPDTNNVSDNTDRNGNYALLDQVTDFISAGLNGWARGTPATQLGGNYDLPAVQRNTNSVDLVSGNYVVTAGAISVHPDMAQIVVVSWLAPRAGTIDISYEFVDQNVGDATDNGVLWFVDKGGTNGNLASGAVSPDLVDSGLLTVSNVTVTTGDRINFVVNPNGLLPLNFSFDSTRVLARINFTDTPGVVHDDEVDFSPTNNTETSMWSYRYQPRNFGPASGLVDFTIRDGNYALLPDHVSQPPLEGWTLHYQVSGRNVGTGFPDIVKNVSGADIVVASTLTITNGQVHIHPDTATLTVVSWLAPMTGAVKITYALSDNNAEYAASPDDNGIAYYIDKGGRTGNLAAGVLNSNILSSGLQVVNNVSVTVGDRINFVVDPNGRNTNDRNSDSTYMFAQVEYGVYLNVSVSGNDVIVTWQGTGILEETTGLVGGTWATVTGATSPYITQASASQKYYRLRL